MSKPAVETSTTDALDILENMDMQGHYQYQRNTETNVLGMTSSLSVSDNEDFQTCQCTVDSRFGRVKTSESAQLA